MAIQRYFETTQLQLRKIFEGRILDRDVAFKGAEFAKNYFRTLFPQYVGLSFIYDMIVGSLRFLHEDLHVDSFSDDELNRSSITFENTTCVFTLYPHMAEDPVIMKMQNFKSSMQPAISLKYKGDKIQNICSPGINFDNSFHYMYMDVLTKVIGDALYHQYSTFKGGKVKWEKL